MAANQQRGSYVAEFLIGFTTVAAGLVTLSIVSPILGVLITIAGLAMLTHACFGFRQIKALEYTDEQ